MPSLQKTLVAKLAEAEQLTAQIKALPKGSEEGKYTIRRWAALLRACSGKQQARSGIIEEKQENTSSRKDVCYD